MITRIVKLTIKPTHIHDFVSAYSEAQQKIRQFEGCAELSLHTDKNNPCIIFTISKWSNEDQLNHYRNSNLFIGIWQSVKPMFAAKAEAWSMEEI